MNASHPPFQFRFAHHQILLNDWLPRVADLVDAMIDYWKDLVPLKSTDGGGRGAILFRCIHALMSLQVQNLIKRSLDHLHGALSVYKVCGRIECHPFCGGECVFGRCGFCVYYRR